MAHMRPQKDYPGLLHAVRMLLDDGTTSTSPQLAPQLVATPSSNRSQHCATSCGWRVKFTCLAVVATSSQCSVSATSS